MPNQFPFLRSLLLSGVCAALLSPALAQEAPEAEEDDVARQQTVVVRGAYIPDEKRSTSEVSSLLDAADFQVQGDSSAASALARLAGISTAEDKFVYVRGLNERYSSALLNGSPLPSPAPLRRVAPLDLFPTSALESILVQKTFSPDLPGEFGGGLVNIRTKGSPDESFLEVSVSASADSQASLKDGLLYDGSDTDYLGYDDGARDLPSLEDGPTLAFGRALTENSSLLVMQRGEVEPNFGANITGGYRYDINENYSIGIISAVGYSSDWTIREGIRGSAVRLSVDDDEISVEEERDRFSTSHEVAVNGLVNVGVDIYDDHEVQFTGLITRSSEKEARQVIGVTEEDAGVFRDDALEWFERELWTTQVRGEHYFPYLADLEVEWRGSYSEALRDAPYQLFNRYRQQSDGRFTLQSSPAANRFLFSRVDDDTTDFGIDATLPFESSSSECTYFCEIDLNFGYSYVENDREAFSRQFDISGTGASGIPDDTRLDYIYSYIFSRDIGSVSETGSVIFPQAYRATLEVDAGYVGVDAQITPFIRAAIGGRFERAIQAVDTFAFDADPDLNFVEACIERQADQSCDHKEDFLPAVTLTWNPIEDLQVRFGYSETLTRPQFRELAPTQFINTETDVTFLGNPFLQNAEIKNYDARAEYYFGRNQFVTLGLFYKDMKNPIEEVFRNVANIDVTSFLNVPAAELYGAEIEYEQIIPIYDWTNWGWFSSKDVTVKTNYTWADSEIDTNGQVFINGGTPVSPVQTLVDASGRLENGRRLQGQSEHLFNFQLGYTDEEANSDANILVNYQSERIRTAESLTDLLPAIVEEPPLLLNFVYNRRFNAYGGDYEFSFQVDNILQEDYEAYQEGGGVTVPVDTYDIGTVFSIGLKREF